MPPAQQLRFDGRVAIVTGAGGGLGKAYALLLASRGAKVVVNDLGGSTAGTGSDRRAAAAVVDEIRAAGGTAVPDYNSVEEGEKIVETALKSFGRVDILICNAGILRDRSFAKMDDGAWDAVLGVHLRGSWKCAKAAWPHMMEAKYGRIIFITSASGLYGNFGQANYAAAKMGIVGLSHTLSKEGAKRGVLVNAVAPIAASRMTEGLMPPDLLDALKPEAVAPLVAYLCHESCSTTGAVFELGGGWMSRLRWQRTKGVFLDVPVGKGAGGAAAAAAAELTPETVAAHWKEATDFSEGATFPDTTQSAFGPMMENLQRAQERAAAPAAAGGGGGGGGGGIATALLAPMPGGNTGKSDAVDVAAALAHAFKPSRASYTERDVALYALSVGASCEDPLDTSDLRLTYELHPDGPIRVLPTFAVLFPHSGMAEISAMDGALRFNPMMLLHGEQEVAFPGPLPPAATTVTTGKITNIYDKGSGAVVLFEAQTRDEASGALLAVNRSSIFVRGIGGFGGDRGPAPDPWPVDPAARRPDFVAKHATTRSSALLYRLNGDTNPLHADPAMAAMGGFSAPILHGLCTFGIAGRLLLRAFGDNDPAKMRAIRGRFAKHVFPGETLVVQAWVGGGGGGGGGTTTVYFRCLVEGRKGGQAAGEVVCLSNGVAVFGDLRAKL